jgi:hypothetical protein
MEEHPTLLPPIEMLRQAIDHQTTVINASLQLHQYLCPPEMKAFHATLHKCKCRWFRSVFLFSLTDIYILCVGLDGYSWFIVFVKNFAEEIGRLPLPSSLSPELLGNRQEELESNQGDDTQKPALNEGYPISRNNSFAQRYDSLSMVGNGSYQLEKRPSLSLSLGGPASLMSNPYAQQDSQAQSIVIGVSPSFSSQIQQGYNYASSNPSSNLQSAPPAGQINTLNGAQPMAMASSHQNMTGSIHEMSSQGMEKQHGLTMGAGEGGYKGPQQMDGINLARTISGPTTSVSEYPYQTFGDVAPANRFGDPSISGSSTLASGPGLAGSQNGSGFGKLIRKGTGTILSHHSGSSRSSLQNGAPAPTHNLTINPPPPTDRKSILGIRFGGRHK